MLAGLFAGLLGFGFSRIVGEPKVAQAIAFEEYVSSSSGHEEAPEAEMVSRSLQSSAGLGTGALIYGAALGGIFALVFTACYGRLGPLSAKGTAVLLGGLGFIALYLIPFLKYPANPPSVGDSETISYRTGLYLAMIAASVAGMALAVVIRQRIINRFGDWNATLLVGAGYIVAMALLYIVLPGVNEVPQQELPTVIEAVTDSNVTFPPTVLWGFRIASLGLQVIVWSTIALVFGWLAQRQLEVKRPAKI